DPGLSVVVRLPHALRRVTALTRRDQLLPGGGARPGIEARAPRGPAPVQELPHGSGRLVDVRRPAKGGLEALAANLLEEALAPSGAAVAPCGDGQARGLFRRNAKNTWQEAKRAAGAALSP
ncbi:hypothetical protein VB636_07055, partial [Paracoccus sp. APAP_BH8]|uniref:hypothetical protein n=1 Tax=Paracoccus sp. APAP_BH8 TaxID=3110237 RepID=UPI002FD83618